MKKWLFIPTVVIAFMLSACVSTSGSVAPENSINKLNSMGPYSIQLQTEDSTLKEMLTQYIQYDFGQYVNISNNAKGKIKVFFISHEQRNDYSTWQNSNMIMQIIGKDGSTMWKGEYNYKAGMELTSFTVNSPMEAGKLTTNRLLKVFKKDFNLK